MDKGTCFIVYLPISKKRNEYHRSEQDDLPLGNENILLVDDEATIVKMGARLWGSWDIQSQQEQAVLTPWNCSDQSQKNLI